MCCLTEQYKVSVQHGAQAVPPQGGRGERKRGCRLVFTCVNVCDR
jgi:hypothetical protein